MRQVFLAGIVFALVFVTGCKSIYYSTMEAFGSEKRDILSSRLVAARDTQKQAQQQFKTTMERFKELTGFQGGDLEQKYNTLKGQYESCDSRAKAVSDRIASLDEVAKDMFTEWRSELAQYQDPNLRAASERKLNETQQRYKDVLATMKRSEASMQPVLAKFHDQVLFLKHNLNAAALNSLNASTSAIESDVTALIKEMEASIAETDKFIATLK
jgi:hypothetical protein